MNINDYKAKSELTAQKLFTSVVAALRSYQHIVSIDLSRRGLEKIIDGSASLFEQQSMSRFVEGVLMQLHSLIQGATGSLLCTVGSQEGDRGPAGSSGFSPVPSPSAPSRDGRWMRSCPPMRWMISAGPSGKAATFIATTTA